MKTLFIIVGSSLLLFGLVTLVALESGDVLVIETIDASADPTATEPRRTHIWYVEEDGQLVLEAGNPENPWVRDIAKEPNVRISGDSVTGTYSLVVDQSELAQNRIRKLMRQKYGWRDVWVSTLFDVSGSQLVNANAIH